MPALYKFIATLLLLLVTSVTGAMAHAALIASDPAEGSTLPAAPATLTLTFTEPVAPTALSLIGIGGAPQNLDQVSVQGMEMTIVLPALADGSYLASWRVTSEDGHPVNGTVSFSVGASSGEIVAPPSDRLLAAAIWLTRLLQYGALFLGVGSLAFGLFAPLPVRAGRIGFGLAIAGLLLVPVAVGLQGLDLLGLPLSDLWTASAVPAGWASTYGVSQLLLGAAFLASILSRIGTQRRRPQVLIAIAALCGVLAPTLSGHASSASPQWLMRPAVFVHLASLLFWLGALLPLGLLLIERSDAALAALSRFSRSIPYAILALVGSGAVLATVQLGWPGGLWFSPYGLLLGGKLIAVALLLALALYNRVALTLPALAGEAAAARHLRRSIRVEIMVVLLILGLVAGWRFTPPPRVLSETAQPPALASLTNDMARADLVATPGHVGRVSVAIVLKQPSGAALAARSVALRLALPEQDIAAISRLAVQGADNVWTVSDLALPAAGTWRVVVEARISEFDLAVLNGTIDIAAGPLAAPKSSPPPALTSDAVRNSCPPGQHFSAKGITVSDAYTRASPPRAASAGGYLTIVNDNAAADELIGVSSKVASKVEVHQMKMEGDIMKMAPVEGGLDIPAGGTVALEPMGYHLMFMQLLMPFKQGECVEVVLQFANAGELPIELNIGTLSQDGPVMDHDMGDMSHDMSEMSHK